MDHHGYPNIYLAFDNMGFFRLVTINRSGQSDIYCYKTLDISKKT